MQTAPVMRKFSRLNRVNGSPPLHLEVRGQPAQFGGVELRTSRYAHLHSVEPGTRAVEHRTPRLVGGPHIRTTQKNRRDLG